MTQKELKELTDFYHAHPEVLVALERERAAEMTDEELEELNAIADERRYERKYDK